jgi:hypothetical protein
MKTRMLVVAITATVGLLVTGALAQHEEHHQDQAGPAAGKTEPGKMGGMMSGNMMSQMPKMMMSQNETGQLVDQLVKSFAAIEAEKDGAALKEKLAEHSALLKELQTKVQSQSRMMETMQHMMGGEHK